MAAFNVRQYCMRLKHPFRFGVLVGLGLYVLQIPIGAAFPITAGFFNALNTPGFWMADSWHGLGLPPQREASVMLLPIAVVLQWLVIGALTGLYLRHTVRKLEKKNA